MRSRGYQVGLLRAVVIFKAPDPKIKHPPKFTTPIQSGPTQKKKPISFPEHLLLGVQKTPSGLRLAL